MPLVIDSNSTCDVCLECYTNANAPHVLTTCCHVFCEQCLDQLAQHECPLCRQEFSFGDARKLHVNLATELKVDDASYVPASPCPDASQHHESQRLLHEIARVVEGGDVDEIQGVIEECSVYYESQPGNQYTTPVRVSCLLLHNLLEAQSELVVQAGQIRETSAARDDIRDRFEAMRLEYEDLERTSQDEQEMALAIERSLREHLIN